jgi:hypothetical protein
MDICKTCGKYMDLVGRVHRCSPQSAVNTAVNTDDAVNTAVNRRGAYPNTDKRRDYMRRYMSKRRATT